MSNSKSTTKKSKLVRDSFSLPKSEYASIEAMKKRAMAVGVSVKKSELLRAGLMWLVGASDSAFKAALMAVPTLKTGRPAAEGTEKPLAKTIAKPANKPAAAKTAPAHKVAAAKKGPMKAVAKTATKMPTKAPSKTPTKAPVKAQAKPAIAKRAAPAKAPVSVPAKDSAHASAKTPVLARGKVTAKKTKTAASRAVTAAPPAASV